MNFKISFKERAKIAKELLAKQPPITIEEARIQAKWLKEISNTDVKKRKYVW